MRDEHRPRCRWVTVVDDAGRRRLEMRWQPPDAVSADAPARAA